MANYTEHYGLHQWVPEDDFLRTDFNADFALIDAALAGLAAADGAESQTRSQEDGALSAAITAGDNAQATALASAKTALQNAITSGDNAQASALSAAKTALQNAINSGDNALDAAKAEMTSGTYTGNGAASRTISLGRAPSAVLVVSNAGQMNSGYYASGGLALAGHGAVKDGAPTITLTSTGFTVYYEQLSASHFVTTNSSGGVYYYLAFFF